MYRRPTDFRTDIDSMLLVRTMTIQRRLTMAVALLLAPACGGRPSPRKIQEIIASSPRFQEPLIAYVPRRITLQPQAVALPDGGETVDAYNPYFRTLSVNAYSVAHISAPT